MLLIALMIVIIMCMMLAFRIVMLWILTILSPLVFFLSTFPRGKAQQAYSEWWSKFGNYLVSGPVLAFFLWLAFTITASGGLQNELATSASLREDSKTSQQYLTNQAGNPEVLASYIIGVALLLGG